MWTEALETDKTIKGGRGGERGRERERQREKLLTFFKTPLL